MSESLTPQPINPNATNAEPTYMAPNQSLNPTSNTTPPIPGPVVRTQLPPSRNELMGDKIKTQVLSAEQIMSVAPSFEGKKVEVSRTEKGAAVNDHYTWAFPSPQLAAHFVDFCMSAGAEVAAKGLQVTFKAKTTREHADRITMARAEVQQQNMQRAVEAARVPDGELPRVGGLAPVGVLADENGMAKNTPTTETPQQKVERLRSEKAAKKAAEATETGGNAQTNAQPQSTDPVAGS